MRRFSGRFRSSMIIGGQGIRSRKLRTLLSMMSLFLGVMAVVVVQAGAELGKRAVLAGSELSMGVDGTLQMYIPPNEGALDATIEAVNGRQDAVVLTIGQAIIGEPGVSPINQGGGQFPDDDPFAGKGGPTRTDMGPPIASKTNGYMACDSRGGCRFVDTGSTRPMPTGRAIALTLTGMTGDVRPYRPYRLVSGEWLDFSGKPSLAPRLVINKEAAKGFARYQVPAEMRISGATANTTPRIIGVVDDGRFEPAAYTRADELFNWMPTEALAGQSGQSGFFGLEIMLAAGSDDTQRILRSKLAGVGITGDQISVQEVQSRKAVAEQLRLMQLLFLGMAGLVLLIGVAGILNVGLATVGERVEEFALRRAVGTSRLLLAGIVLAETLLIGLFTAALAIGMGVAGLEVAGGFIQARMPFLGEVGFPWQAGVAGVIAGLIAGILGGCIPAIRAARIPIATVMRA